MTSIKTLVINALCISIWIIPGIQSQIFAQPTRQTISLNPNWKTIASDNDSALYMGFEKTGFDDRKWLSTDVPHNWDDYAGYRTLRHGNRHGYAWYRKEFQANASLKDKKLFLYFEGVSSYATVWVNGQKAGYHAGGRTTFTLDISSLVRFGQSNVLAVRADHPANIQDLPWVCGGCSVENGFSEGSQPMGIFRPVSMIVTNPIRIEPFGVHVWTNKDVSEKSAIVNFETEVKNYSNKSQNIKLLNLIVDRNGKTVSSQTEQAVLNAGQISSFRQQSPIITNPKLWSPSSPYLYKLITKVLVNSTLVDSLTTSFGIRWISWPDSVGQPFKINGKPFFINGTAEYEHLFGQGHAFSNEQIDARVAQFRACGYNSFRDAHQPHNLRYNPNWDSLGILWWPQMAAHVWYDTPEFRTNFKNLLRDWVRERRNSPSIILWGVENESTLPQGFAEECAAIIRELDPTASSQRKITSCNFGRGLDWNIPQNWTGTYGGSAKKYGEDLKKQQLVGEYGSWRNLGLHSESGTAPKIVASEDSMTELMELKIRLADSVKTQTCGHYHWILNSHDNPGRSQNGESFENINRVGPVNYKGLFTIWDEPSDAFYLYRSNFVAKEREPMVYIVSHTWPDRWTSPGVKNGIAVYSNCDEVELFNDVRSQSLGKRKRGGVGTHFEWNNVTVSYNVLYVEGRVNGKLVASDCIVLNHLPKAPHFSELYSKNNITCNDTVGYKYIYRVNCGGPNYTDKNGNRWMADASGNDSATWSSHSWDEDFKDLPPFFASSGKTNDPISGTEDWKLFQNYRFGRHKLNYTFPVPDGDYRVELYFVEPWYGTGGNLNAAGWRVFDVVINDSTVLKNLDIWKEAGHDKLLKKSVIAHIRGGKLKISFPKTTVNQAIITAIAIASTKQNIQPAPAPKLLIDSIQANGWSAESWLDTDVKQYNDDSCTFASIPQELYGDQWIRTNSKNAAFQPSFKLNKDCQVYIAIDTLNKPSFLNDWAKTSLSITNDKNQSFTLYKKMAKSSEKIKLYNPSQLADKQPNIHAVIAHRLSVFELAPEPVRISTTYEAENARLSGFEIKTGGKDISGKASVASLHTSNDTIEWLITVGVGDTYALRFKYASNQPKDVLTRLSVIDKDDNVLNSGNVTFSPTSGEWDRIITTTGTNINAGTYRIRLITQGEGLMFDNLKVQ